MLTNFEVNLTTILSGLILASILGVFAQLRKLNSRLGKVEAWQGGHEKMDDERFGGLKESIRDLWTALDGLRQRLSG